ncbi:hypothetical protein M5689_022345 [Euphorbia peplus]|nr:hypothetical protein M5689_022345 [Euphorbia peplus]
MELTELSLAPRRKFGGEKGNINININSSSSESENNFSGSKKRKFFSSESSVDLHVKDPLPMDWEQCLDLQSGRMYYLNRKTLRKSWNWPINKDHHHHQKLDLELHISAPDHHHHHYHHHHHHQDNNNNNSNYKKQAMTSSTSSNCNNNNNNRENNNNDNMVALACLNCHLLVILSRSSPSCPNCKYVHSLPLISSNPLPKISAPSKSLHTLSLLD